MRKDPPLNMEVDDPVVILGHAYLRVTPNSVHTNDPGLCVSVYVSVRPRLRGIYIWYRCAKVRLSPWSRVARSISWIVCVCVRVCTTKTTRYLYLVSLCKSAPVTMVTSCALYIGCKDVQLAKIRGTQNESKNHAPSLGLQTFWIRQFADIPEVELFQGFARFWVVKLALEKLCMNM